MRRLIDKLLTGAAPRRVRGWVIAMLAEAHGLDRGERLGWYVAAARVALAHRLSELALPLQALVLAAVMVFIDWTWGTLLPALALMGLSAGTIRKPLVALLVAAGTLPGAHAIANWLPALRPHYQYAELDATDWAILAAVAGIGICAVRIAAMFRARGTAVSHG